MRKTLGINGFGRIGRLVLRAFYERNLHKKGYTIKTICDTARREEAVHLFVHDSTHGTFSKPVDITQGGFAIDHEAEIFFANRTLIQDDENFWKNKDVDCVLDCSGAFTKNGEARYHIDRGARKVLISSPAQGVDFTAVEGVNAHALKNTHLIVSNASCTTNCLAPLILVLDRLFGVKSGHATTVHAMTNDQVILDRHHRDPRRARAAHTSMIPTSTGASKALCALFPHLEGHFQASSIRVPTPNVSVIDLVVQTSKAPPQDQDALNYAIKTGALEDNLAHVMRVSSLPLVSIDYNHSTHSCIVDALETKIIDDNIRVLAWYDNEWAFAQRMLDVAMRMIAM